MLLLSFCDATAVLQICYQRILQYGAGAIGVNR